MTMRGDFRLIYLLISLKIKKIINIIYNYRISYLKIIFSFRLAAESDIMSHEVEQLDSCILSRKFMLENLAIQSTSGSVEELEEQILAYAHNSKHASQKIEDTFQALETQSNKSSDGGNFSDSGMCSRCFLIKNSSLQIDISQFTNRIYNQEHKKLTCFQKSVSTNLASSIRTRVYQTRTRPSVPWAHPKRV